MSDFDWGSASKRDFKRREMEHELRHEEPQRKSYSGARPFRSSAPKATGMIYHSAGSKTDKNGKKYDFHHGDQASGQSVASATGGKLHMFKTLKEFVVEADGIANANVPFDDTIEATDKKPTKSGKSKDEVIINPDSTETPEVDLDQ